MIKTLRRVFKSYNGRHFLSRWARNIFENEKVRQVVGVNLAAVAILMAVLEPQAEAFTAKKKAETLPTPNITEEIETTTETTLAWPTVKGEISQGYHFGHWGIDITDRESKEIHPIDRGWVSAIIYSKWQSYGNHIIIQHPNGRSSLYAHLEEVYVEPGQEVTRDSVIGKMGRTGWATGVHLHLEIYQDGKTLNPLEVLPKQVI